MVVVYVCVAFCMWTGYCYLIPHYFVNDKLQNDWDLKLRMRDYLATTVYEELFGNQFLELALTPHEFELCRTEMLEGYSHPDDVRNVHFTTLNRKHKYKEHYLTNPGNHSPNMLGPN